MATGSDKVKAALAAASDAAPTGDPHGGGGDGEGGDGRGAAKALPGTSPVTAVGTENGVFYFLSTLGELRGLKADQVANKHIVALFAPKSDYLLAEWPRKKLVQSVGPNGEALTDEHGNKIMEWIVTGWRTDDVSMLLMDAAAAKGVWNARERVRGRGGWLADDGGLILHAGDRVLIGGHWRAPGLYDEMVYPTQPAIPRPAREAADARLLAPRLHEYLWDHAPEHAHVPASPNVGETLLALFQCWRFARTDADAMLLLGWNALAMYGGALDYRPLIWLTGDKATGKSALQKAIGLLHGNGILQSPDATEAAVRQIMGHQSLPVAIDEAEADEDNRKMLALVKLARLAATSQGNILRGGQDHEGHEFQATSCFLFSSILIPPIPPQDKSRLAVLELDELPGEAREPPLTKVELSQLGEQMRLVMAQRWKLWPARLAAFRNAMIDTGGHQGRVADQFGSLLAGAHLLLSEEEPSADELARWGKMLSVETLVETSDNASEASRCLNHLVHKPVQLAKHSERRTIGEWLLQAVTPGHDRPGLPDEDAATRRHSASEAIERVGLKIFHGGKSQRDAKATGKKQPIPGVVYLAVASSHQGLAEVFQGSRWGNEVWAQAMRRVPGAIPHERQRIGGRVTACTLVPLDELVTPERVEEREREREDAE